MRCRRVLLNKILKNPNHLPRINPSTHFFRFLEHVSSTFLDSEKPENLKKNFLSVERGSFERGNHLMSPDVNTEGSTDEVRKKTFQKLISVPHKESLEESFFFVAQSSIGAKSFYSSISSYSNRLWWLINISISLSFILLHFNLSSIYFSIVPSCRDYKSAIKYVFCLKSHERRPDLVRVFHFWHSRRFQLGYSNFLFISNQLES